MNDFARSRPRSSSVVWRLRSFTPPATDRCDEVVKGAAGEIEALHCSVDFDDAGQEPGRAQGESGWSTGSARPMARSSLQVRLYDNLLPRGAADKDKDADFEHLNPESRWSRCRGHRRTTQPGCAPESRFQSERVGYFCADCCMPASRASLRSIAPSV
ncbi:hypothetical protein DSL92_00655 [Billgrantia gudaonensis]|uniref:50S ribosomal protein L25 n=1 Tax=Billgrantia gudaonensis TaxID=376427 RepID=A0A3S0QGK5_9GAMM|nr:hypothetical protein DSL92_00655 [Halomonas gudaonensis]